MYRKSSLSHTRILWHTQGHRQLWDRADLDTRFLTHPIWNQGLSRNPLQFRSVLLDFQPFTEKPVLSVLLLTLRYYFYHIWLKTVFIPSPLYIQSIFEMVSNAHVRQLTHTNYYNYYQWLPFGLTLYQNEKHYILKIYWRHLQWLLSSPLGRPLQMLAALETIC